MRFSEITWNLLEAGHGKDPSDGIGDAVKNAADRAVAYSRDICSLNDLLARVEHINVKMMSEDLSDIDRLKNYLFLCL